MNVKETQKKKKTWWELHKKAVYCLEQILGATPHKTAAVRPHACHLPKHSIRWTRHAKHCRRSKNKLLRDVLLWTPAHGRVSIGRPAKTYINSVRTDFFGQAFKIVIDSSKFSILLLYILWDDWPIFMISASNEQLQQQLEYTLLKPDCHSWWISKMLSGREDTLEERYAIKFCFKLAKNATETYEMLQNRAWVFEWHKRFKEGKESVRDDERCGRSKEVRTPELIGQRVRVRVTMLKF